MQDKPMQEQESLALIQAMIATAKQGVKANGKGFITWGWILAAACLSTYILFMVHFKYPLLPWSILTIGGIIAIVVNIFKEPAPGKVKTYMDELLKGFSTGFYICLVIIVAAMNLDVMNVLTGFSMLLMLYGLLMYVVGYSIKFNPLITGAIVTWAGCLVGLYLKSTAYLMLISAGAIIVGFIIPGYNLKKAWKNNPY